MAGGPNEPSGAPHGHFCGSGDDARGRRFYLSRCEVSRFAGLLGRPAEHGRRRGDRQKDKSRHQIFSASEHRHFFLPEICINFKTSGWLRVVVLDQFVAGGAADAAPRFSTALKM